MAEQNYSNHSRYVPLFHFATFTAILALLGGAVYKLIKNQQMGVGGIAVPLLLIATALILVSVALFARVFALKAQDRAIRAEENLRYFAMTGKLLDSKLSTQQIIALRFASNSEFVDLAHRAVAENMKPNDIKKAIKHWKADYHRV